MTLINTPDGPTLGPAEPADEAALRAEIATLQAELAEVQHLADGYRRALGAVADSEPSALVIRLPRPLSELEVRAIISAVGAIISGATPTGALLAGEVGRVVSAA